MEIKSSQSVLLIRDKSGFIDSLKSNLQAEILDIVESDTKLHTILSSYYDHIITFNPNSQEALFEFLRILKPSGVLHLLDSSQNREFDCSSKLNSELVISGFTNTSITDYCGYIMTSAIKPNWEVGSTQSLRKNKKADWSKLASGDNVKLIDEESLLDESDLVKPRKVDDCEIGTTKRACKGCTCGRADEEGTVTKKLTLEMLENPGVDSSCGSCSLGDAFRCSGCPYKGLPSFTPGQKIVLDDDFDIDSLISN